MQMQFGIISHRTEQNEHRNRKKVSNTPILSFLLREFHLYSARTSAKGKIKKRKEKKRGRKEKIGAQEAEGKKERGKPRRKGTMEGNRSEGNNLAARARG